MRFVGSITEVGNEFGGTIPFGGGGAEGDLRFGSGGTTPLGVAVVSFRSVSTLGGKHVRNGSEVLCPVINYREFDNSHSLSMEVSELKSFLSSM